jgi:protease IV
MKRKTKWILVVIAVIGIIWGIDALKTSLSPAIGLLEVNGIIAESMPYLDAIKDFQDDKSVKAVVVRLDSPGGKVGPSQEIYNALLKLKKKKPLIMSMGSLGASGAYYIALSGDTIYALPGTMTGSIGVIMEFFDVSNGMNKLGIKPENITAGTLKDAGSPFRHMTEKERKYFKALVDDVHDQFIEAVSKNRKIKPDIARTLADGRVFTGRQALKAGLIDKLGGLGDAVDEAKKKAGIVGEARIIRPDVSGGVWASFKKLLGIYAPIIPLRADPTQGLGYYTQSVRLEYNMN